MLNADDELRLIRAAQHDRAAFGDLYDAYVDLVWRFAMKRLGDQDRAADATSQTFIKAMAALPTFRPERRGEVTTFRSWLIMIARNTVFDDLRAQSRSDERSANDLENVTDPEPWPDQQLVSQEEIHRVRQALNELPALQRQIVEMRAHGASVREIASITSLTESAVKSAHYRAHKRLRELLTKEEDL